MYYYGNKKNMPATYPTGNRWNHQIRTIQRGLFTKDLITNEWIIQMETPRDSAGNLGMRNI